MHGYINFVAVPNLLTYAQNSCQKSNRKQLFKKSTKNHLYITNMHVCLASSSVFQHKPLPFSVFPVQALFSVFIHRLCLIRKKYTDLLAVCKEPLICSVSFLDHLWLDFNISNSTPAFGLVACFNNFFCLSFIYIFFYFLIYLLFHNFICILFPWLVIFPTY
jgi:hypothetical protein